MWNRWLSMTVAGVLLLGAGACSSTDANEPVDLAFFDAARPVAFLDLEAAVMTLDQSSVGNSDLTERRNLVLTNQADFENLWDALHANLGEPPPLPAVDFSREMVLAVILGLRNSGGYEVTIRAVAEQEGRLGVLVEETAPDDDCATLAVLTSPYHLIKLDAVSSDIHFLDTRLIASCGG